MTQGSQFNVGTLREALGPSLAQPATPSPQRRDKITTGPQSARRLPSLAGAITGRIRSTGPCRHRHLLSCQWSWLLRWKRTGDQTSGGIGNGLTPSTIAKFQLNRESE